MQDSFYGVRSGRRTVLADSSMLKVHITIAPEDLKKVAKVDFAFD
jgi:hypothetical protein